MMDNDHPVQSDILQMLLLLLEGTDSRKEPANEESENDFEHVEDMAVDNLTCVATCSLEEEM